MLILLLAIIPMLFEAGTVAGIAKSLYGLPILFCFSLGFVIGAVSPGVLIPSCMHLQKDGYGVDKEIPTTLIASASFSDIIAIEIFGVFTEFEINKVSDKKATVKGDLLYNIALIGGGLIIGIL